MSDDNNQNTIFDSRKEQKKREELQKRIQAARRSGGFFEQGEREAQRGTSERKPELKEESKITRRREQRKEFTVFRRVEYVEQKKVYKEIEEVRKEILLAVKAMNEMSAQVKEVERAAMERTVEPGIYHVNFFEKLKNLLQVFRKNIKESKNWLDLTFSRMRKKRYWNRAKKGGSSYMLSGERRVATQAG